VRAFYDRQEGRYKIFPELLDILQEEGRAGRFGIRGRGYSYILVYGGNPSRVER
jgi:helicase